MINLITAVAAPIATVIHITLGCGGRKKKEAPGFAFRSGTTVGGQSVGAKSGSESVNMEEKKEKRSAVDDLVPKKSELGPKERAIARGAFKKASEYPTYDDIPSDWDESDSKMVGDKKEEKKKEKKK